MNRRPVFQIGERVAYRDMANNAEGKVVAVATSLIWLPSWTAGAGTTYTASPIGVEHQIRWDDGDESWSDCLQRGWSLVASRFVPGGE